MPNHWLLLLMAALLTAMPLYLFVTGDGFGAALIGVPSFLIGAAIFVCLNALRA